MDQRIRLATAAAVMLAGLGVALLFRRPAAENGDSIPLPSDPLVLRKQPDPRSLAGSELPPPVPSHPQPASAEPARSSPTIITPVDRPTPPPELPKTYPDSPSFSAVAGNHYSNGGQLESTRWGASLSEMLPETTSAPPTHKVIDGDSLALLAERYLGSASRAMEIFEANRNVLNEPDILPMGVELKIPRAPQTALRKP